MPFKQHSAKLIVKSITEVANQSETKRHIFHCVTAKSSIMHMGTHELHSNSSSLTHLLLLS